MNFEDEMIHGCPARSRATRRHHLPRQRPGAPQPVPATAPRHFTGQQAPAGEWDASAQLYQQIQESTNPGRGSSPRRARIEEDTPIAPRALAQHVCEEASLWLGEPFPDAWVAELAERAAVIYQHNARFRRLVRKPGDAGRDWLQAFMRHWLFALLASRRADLRERLPSSYAAGHDLPPRGDTRLQPPVGRVPRPGVSVGAVRPLPHPHTFAA